MPTDPQDGPAHCDACECKVWSADALDENGRCGACRLIWEMRYCTCGHLRHDHPGQIAGEYHGDCIYCECTVFDYDPNQNA